MIQVSYFSSEQLLAYIGMSIYIKSTSSYSFYKQKGLANQEM